MKFTWKKTGHGLTDNLGNQMQKIVRSMNQNRIGTRRRYIAAEKRFISYVAKEFRLQKLANVKDKHLEKYVKYLKNNGNSDKYVKNELSAIRFFHNHTPGARYELTDSTVFNKLVGLGSTPDIKDVDRAWEEKEISSMKEIANMLGRPEISSVIEVMRSTGCRIDEACTLRDSDLRKALSEGKLHLTNTKGGVPRDVPLTNRARTLFQRQLKLVGRGEYAFTPQDYVVNRKIHAFEKSVQNFIYNHRDKVQLSDRAITGHNVNPGEKGALTAHGLRHSFAREQYFKIREEGFSKEHAKEEVAEMLGHHRAEITKVYLGGLE